MQFRFTNLNIFLFITFYSTKSVLIFFISFILFFIPIVFILIKTTLRYNLKQYKKRESIEFFLELVEEPNTRCLFSNVVFRTRRTCLKLQCTQILMYNYTSESKMLSSDLFIAASSNLFISPKIR